MGMAARKLDPEYERLNIANLAMRFDLNRETVVKRIRNAGIEPVELRAKEKLYELTSRLITVLEQRNEKLEEVKLRGETAKAQLVEIKVKQAEGELVPMAEAVELVHKIISRIYQEFAVRQPKRIAGHLARKKTAIEVKKILKADTDKIMKGVRTNFEEFLK